MGVNRANQIYQWTAQGWTQMPGAALNVAVVNSTKAFAWNGTAVWVWNGTAWTLFPTLPPGVTGFNWMSAASDGTLYAVDTTGNINRLDAQTGAWSVVGSNAGHIAAQSGSVFYMLQSGKGTLPAGTIQMVSGGTTTTLPGILTDITVDLAGDLWGVNGNDNVYHWNGTNWDLEPGTFTQIAVGNATTLWAINANAQGAISQWH
jgi:Tectonin domain